jgi:DNA polymerase-3 subunit alpha
MIDMFGGVAAADVQLRVRTTSPGPRPCGCRREYDAVGFFLSGHPLDEYGTSADAARADLGEFLPLREGRQSAGRVAATVLDRTERRTKTGNKMGIVNLSDQTGHFEAIVFSEGCSLGTFWSRRAVCSSSRRGEGEGE